MKIAILGSNGFIGSNISIYLRQYHNVVDINRDTLNLLNFSDVRSFLQNHKFDVIINAAAIMTHPELLWDTRNNLTIFMNFFNNSTLFGKFINLGSGAEYDRSLDISSIKEFEVFNRFPVDSYGYGQNIKSRLCYEKDNFYGLKIFNCFGLGEPSTRIFNLLLNDQKLEIFNDRYFDYFYIKDLFSVIDYCIYNVVREKDINCVYPKKYKISEVAMEFSVINNLNCDISIVSVSDNNYTGNSDNIASIGLDFLGLHFGLKDYKIGNI